MQEDRPTLRLGTWQDKQTFGCPFCPFDSLSEQTALDHVYEVHKQNAKPVHGALFDAAGNLIAR